MSADAGLTGKFLAVDEHLDREFGKKRNPRSPKRRGLDAYIKQGMWFGAGSGDITIALKEKLLGDSRRAGNWQGGEHGTKTRTVSGLLSRLHGSFSWTKLTKSIIEIELADLDTSSPKAGRSRFGWGTPEGRAHGGDGGVRRQRQTEKQSNASALEFDMRLSGRSVRRPDSSRGVWSGIRGRAEFERRKILRYREGFAGAGKTSWVRAGGCQDGSTSTNTVWLSPCGNRGKGWRRRRVRKLLGGMLL